LAPAAGRDEHVRAAIADSATSVADMLIQTELEIDPVICDSAMAYRRARTG
jgi:hypothetical protein